MDAFWPDELYFSEGEEMEFLNEIPTTWLVGAITTAYLTIIGAYGAIIRYFFKQRKESQRARREMRALIGSLDTKMEAGFTELRREIQAGDAALKQEIGRLTIVVIGLAEKVGETRGRPEEVPAPAERIAEAG